jgi:hypothetical protein
MFTRLNKVYHEFPALFWTVVTVRFVDGIGGTLLFPFFALYITGKFGVGMLEAGILLGMSSGSGSKHMIESNRQVIFNDEPTSYQMMHILSFRKG